MLQLTRELLRQVPPALRPWMATALLVAITLWIAGTGLAAFR